MNRWTRREVLQGLGRLPLFAGFAAVVSACGGGSSAGSGYGGSGGGGGGSGGASTLTCSTTPVIHYTVSANHGHTACMSPAQLNGTDAIDPNVITLSDVGHTHTISLTDAEMAGIKAGTGGNIAKTSTTSGTHHHVVTFIV